jgi:hypothetical protein
MSPTPECAIGLVQIDIDIYLNQSRRRDSVRTHKTVLNTAVGLALAALGTGAMAADIVVAPQVPTYATENFGANTLTSTYDTVTLPTGLTATFTTTSGASGGYVVNNGGQVYYYLKLNNGAKFLSVGTFNLVNFPALTTDTTTPGWVVSGSSFSADGTFAVVTIQNVSGNTQAIGAGAQVIWNAAGAQFLPGDGVRTAGAAQVNVSGTLAPTFSTSSVPTSFIDASGFQSITATADAISGSVTAGTTTKIAVDATSQRKNFVPAPTAVATLGYIQFTDIPNDQKIATDPNDLSGYLTTNPTGRSIAITVTAGSGSFNAGTVGTSPNADCSGATAGVPTDVTATVWNMSVAATTAPVYVCYTTTGAVQINEVASSAQAVLTQPSTFRNDQTRTASGALAKIVNDGTVIDTRIYIPVAVNQFGYGMSLRIINTGSTDAGPVLAQYIYDDGSLGTQATVANLIKVNGYVMLENTAIETALGAPNAAKGPNPRVRIVAPTSSLRVQTFMRTNGVWAEVSGGQGEAQNLQVLGFPVTPSVSATNDK